MSRRLTTEEFIERAKQIHGDKYDYSKVNYIDIITKVCIICPIHGEFWQKPNDHLNNKHGCPICRYDKTKEKITLTTDEFVKRAKQVHGDKYDYSKVEYKNSSTKVCIICPIHGEFWQTPLAHYNKQGCPKCCGNQNLTTEQFIERARQIHGDKYDYSKVEYKNNSTKICIICPIHGEFWQRPYDHLEGHACSKCRSDKLSLTTEEFIEKAKQVHGDKYDYSKVEYKNSHAKVCIICPEHGEFWQRPTQHLFNNGCPFCHNRWKLEQDVKKELSKYFVFEENLRYGFLNNLQLDFYLPNLNIAIECQGIQHFKPIKFWGGEEAFKKRVERDERKRKLCEENGIKLLYYSDLKIDYPYKVYTNINNLIDEIKNGS